MDNKTKLIYLSIDCSNYFNESAGEEKDIIAYKETILNESNKEENFDILKVFTNKYKEKYFPDEKDNDNFLLSLHISKNFYKQKNLKKNTIEKNINFYFDKRISITYSNSFSLDYDGLKNIGNILSYIFVRLEHIKIKTKKEVFENIKISNQQNVNVLTDFYNYCVNNNLPPNEESKSLYWYKNKKKYLVPAELLFLNNLFNKITTFDFDINFQDELFTEELYRYLVLILMNLDLFLTNLQYIKFNFIHEKFQNLYYNLYHKEILNIIYPDTLKINKNKTKDTLYTRKWNFDKNFMLEECRNIELIKKNKMKKKIEDKQYGDFTIIQERSQTTFNNFYLKKNDSIIDSFEYEDILTSSAQLSTPLFEDFQNDISNKSLNYMKRRSLNDIKFDREINKTIHLYYSAIEKNHYSFEILFILFNYISNYEINKIDIIMNDSYTSELVYYFKNYFRIDIRKEDDNFHLLDLFTKALSQIRTLNIEFDSLDLNSFDKILKIILNNTNMKELKISFFTCDINYFPYTLLRIHKRFTKKNKIKVENSENNENILLDFFYPYFKNNLLFMLYLIKKKSFNKIGFNFDIPLIVQKKDNYMITMMKFLLNMFIYLNDPNCKLNEVTLLSPKTILDGRLLNNIDLIFKEMDFNINNMYLYELNVQFTIFNIPNIKNIISRNLLTLSIGDLDIPTFESIVNYLNSYSFASFSLMRKLSIKLMKLIDNFSPKLKIILRSLFNIKLKNLKKLCLYTNIIIKNESECTYLLKILNGNWISSYTLIFNKLSQEFFKGYTNNNQITYLVPHNLENELIGPEKNNNKNISTNMDDTVYWFLKYIFNKRYYYIPRNFKAHKYYIYNILKYLYFEKKIKICYNLQNSEEENQK